MENNPPSVSSTDLRRIFTKALVLPDSVEVVHSLIDTCEKYGFRWRQLFIKQMALCPPSPERSALLGTISPLLMGEHAHKEMSAASILDLGRIIIDQKAWDLVPILHAPGRVSNQEFEFGLRHHYVSALAQGTWIDISNFNPPLLSSLDHKQLSDFFWASMSPDRDKLPGDHESDLNIFRKLCDLGMFKDQETLMRSVSKAIAFRRIECEDWDQFLNAGNFEAKLRWMFSNEWCPSLSIREQINRFPLREGFEIYDQNLGKIEAETRAQLIDGATTHTSPRAIHRSRL